MKGIGGRKEEGKGVERTRIGRGMKERGKGKGED